MDAQLDQANIDLGNYVTYLDGLAFDFQETGNYTDNFTPGVTAKDLTVFDFEEVEAKDKIWTFTGRDGFSDKIVIRVAENFEMESTVVNLVNLEAEDVTWYSSADGDKDKFDLHTGDPRSEFAGIIVSPDAQVRLGEVNFEGSVYGSDLKLGSGNEFTGVVPEPSASLMLLLSGLGLVIYRRR